MALNRLRIQKQLELSTVAGSIITTTAAFEPQYVPPGADGTVLQIVAGVPTWIAAAAGSFILSDGTNSQVIVNGDTLTATAGSGITAVVSTTDTLTISSRLSTDAGNGLIFGSDTGLYVPQAQLLTGATWSDLTNTITLAFANGSTIDIPIVDVVSTFLFDFTVAGNTGTDLVNNHETLTVVGGATSGITTAVTANTITINRNEVEDLFTGLVTGSTVTLSATPIAGTIVNVYRNGVKQYPGVANDFTISGTIVTFTDSFGNSNGASAVGETVQVTFVA